MEEKLCILKSEFEKASSFSQVMRDTMCQLNDAEDLLFAEFTPPGLSATCQAMIDQYQQLESEKLIPLKSAIVFLKEEGEKLTSQKCYRDKEVVMSWLKDIEMRFSELLAENERKQVMFSLCIQQHYPM